jgi:hypothetical protein
MRKRKRGVGYCSPRVQIELERDGAVTSGERERREGEALGRRGEGEGEVSGPAWPMQERGGERGPRVGLLGSLSFPSSFLFLLHTQTTQTIPFEFK